ncbi:hypothetical protein acdb102_34410 [Acidothermaceae bacterium B102]|nr:hypothetical protein acdb102_34410 [Acidothermaceae bacterium B102]
MDIDIPLLVSPSSLSRLHDDLAAAALRVGRIAGQVEQVAAQGGWRGGAERAFATAARTAGAQCDVLARRLSADAARVDQLAEELIDELHELQCMEDELLDAVHELARRVLADTTGQAAAAYERARHLLPAHLSPHWRAVASTIRGLL